MSLTLYYFIISLIKYLTRHTRLSAISRAISFCQFLVLPILLIYHLNAFSGELSGPFKAFAILPWKTLMTWSTPVFTLLEGFATLLVIQASGQISRYLVNHKSDSWMIALLVASGSVISWAVYFLWRIYSFPDILTIKDATLIGVLLTGAIILCAYGISSGKGNLIESSLLFAYLVFCIYETFTDFKSATPLTPSGKKPEVPPFPPFFMESAQKFASSLPDAISQLTAFISAAFSSLSPSVCISLGYRTIVLYLTTRIIPAIRSFTSSEPTGRLVPIVLTFSPCLLIGVYTHLLMTHYEMIQDAGIWHWINAFGILVLYSVELLYGDEQEGVVSDWKIE